MGYGPDPVANSVRGVVAAIRRGHADKGDCKSDGKVAGQRQGHPVSRQDSTGGEVAGYSRRRLATKIRNSNIEIRNNGKIQVLNVKNLVTLFLISCFFHWSLF